MATRKREWTTIKVIAKHTEKAAHQQVKASVLGLLDVRKGKGGVIGVQKQKHGNFVPRDGQAVLWGILVSCPGLGEWGDCTFCTFLGNGIGIVMACCPGNLPEIWYTENLPSLSHVKCPNTGEVTLEYPKARDVL